MMKSLGLTTTRRRRHRCSKPSMWATTINPFRRASGYWAAPSAGNLSGLIAPGAGCKTSVRVVQVLSVASGKPLTGEHVFVRANVLIVCLEDGMTELRRRVRAAMKHHCVAREEVKGRLFLSTPTGMKMALRGPKASTVVPGDLDRAIRSFIDGRKIDLVIIDPIKKAHSVEENDNNDMDAGHHHPRSARYREEHCG
jgi:RecA-family ATPase